MMLQQRADRTMSTLPASQQPLRRDILVANSRHAHRLQKMWGVDSCKARNIVPFVKITGPQRCSQQRLHAIAMSASNEPSIQLATAKLPGQIDADKFATNMYQWASTLTSSGQNMPFTLPLRTKKLSNGFQISLLRISEGEPVAVGHINAEVEDEASVGSVFFVRFYEGEGSALINKKLPSDPQARLKTIIDGLMDITTIMRTMKSAIKETANRSKK